MRRIIVTTIGIILIMSLVIISTLDFNKDGNKFTKVRVADANITCWTFLY